MLGVRSVGHNPEFRHEALIYEGRRGFLDSSAPFIREGLRAGEPVLVLVAGHKIEWLLDELGDDAADVFFEDVAEAGANPGRLIDHWHQFDRAHSEAPALRGIGELAGPDRSAEALDECRRHEALLNLAFDGKRDFWLLCPYDAAELPPDLVAGARRTHPLIAENGGEHPSDHYEDGFGTLAGELSPPPSGAVELEFRAGDTRAIRAFADDHGRAHELSLTDLENLVFAAGELAANSIQHGGGHGTIVAWGGVGSAVLEVRDSGVIRDPLVGRVRPGLDGARGRGLWLLEQLCDLVQIRSGPEGTVVRVHTGANGSRVARRRRPA